MRVVSHTLERSTRRSALLIALEQGRTVLISGSCFRKVSACNPERRSDIRRDPNRNDRRFVYDLMDRLRNDPVFQQSLRCSDKSNRARCDFIRVNFVRLADVVRQISQDGVHVEDRPHKLHMSICRQRVYAGMRVNPEGKA